MLQLRKAPLKLVVGQFNPEQVKNYYTSVKSNHFICNLCETSNTSDKRILDELKKHLLSAHKKRCFGHCGVCRLILTQRSNYSHFKNDNEFGLISTSPAAASNIDKNINVEVINNTISQIKTRDGHYGHCGLIYYKYLNPSNGSTNYSKSSHNETNETCNYIKRLKDIKN